jgi:hypothetical protein
MDAAAHTNADQESGAQSYTSPSLTALTGALQYISTRNLHDITVTLPDDNRFLKSWRRQLQECMNQQNARLLRFLVADTSGTELSEAEIVRRCTDVVSRYSRPTLAAGASIRDLALDTSTAQTVAELERDLGISPFALRDGLKRAVRLYTSTAVALTTAETHLDEKLRRLETVARRIDDLMFMEPTPQMQPLAEQVRPYLDSVYNKISIEEDYRTIVEQHKKFVLLKNIMALGTFQRPTTAPICRICEVKEVSRAMAPCGHTFCEDCAGRQMTACYMCRVQVRDKLPLYFS